MVFVCQGKITLFLAKMGDRMWLYSVENVTPLSILIIDNLLLTCFINSTF